MLSNNILWNSEHSILFYHHFSICFILFSLELFFLYLQFFHSSKDLSLILLSYLVFFHMLNHLTDYYQRPLNISFFFIFMLLSIHNNNTVRKWIFFHPSFQSLLKSYDLKLFSVTKFTLNSREQRSFLNS